MTDQLDLALSSDEVFFEGMTSVSALIESISQKESDRRIIELIFDKSRLYKKQRELRFLGVKSKELGFPIRIADSESISLLASGSTHGGIVARATARTYRALSPSDLSDKDFWVLLDGIEDPYNFGYSIRSLYAAGVTGLILPERNWLSAAGVVARASAGTSEKMKIRIADPAEAVKCMKASGFTTCAAEIRDSESLYEADLSLPLLFVIGGEKRGISREVLSLCDKNIRIPYGIEFRGSLSAAATCAVIGFEVMHRNKRF